MPFVSPLYALLTLDMVAGLMLLAASFIINLVLWFFYFFFDLPVSLVVGSLRDFNQGILGIAAAWIVLDLVLLTIGYMGSEYCFKRESHSIK